MKWLRTHKPHLAAAIAGTIIGVPMLWFALAYGGLPRLWSHHEHKKGKVNGVLVSYTAQGIPGDPINLLILGSQTALECELRRAGWNEAEELSARSGLKIAASVLLSHPYPDAPISPLYLDDRQQDLAYELDEGASADRRHHVRFWRQGPAGWLGSATFDRGVGLSLFTLQITHHIGPAVGLERDRVARALVQNGAVWVANASGGRVPGKVHRNGGGDHYIFDGQIAVLSLPATCEGLARKDTRGYAGRQGQHL